MTPNVQTLNDTTILLNKMLRRLGEDRYGIRLTVRSPDDQMQDFIYFPGTLINQYPQLDITPFKELTSGEEEGSDS